MAKRVFELQGRLAGADLGLNLGPDLDRVVKTTEAGKEIQFTAPFTAALVPDSSLITFEGWAYYEASTFALTFFRTRNSGGGVQSSINLAASNRWNINLDQAVFSDCFFVGQTTGKNFPDYTWIHLLFSADMTSPSTPVIQVALNGILIPDGDWSLDLRNGGTTYSFSNTSVASFMESHLAAVGHAVGRVWMAQTYIDLSSAANIAKFIDVADHYKPVQLGPDGSNPDTTLPFFFMQNLVTDILVNLGTERDADALDGNWTQSPHSPVAPAIYAHGTAASPNQSGLEMTTAAAGFTDSLTFSCALWFKTSLITTAGEILIAGAGTSDKLLISYNTSGVITVAAKNAAGTTIISGIATGDISSTTWQHLAVSINMAAATGAAALRISIDGTDVTSTVATFVTGELINFSETAAIFALFNHSGRTAVTTGEFSQFWADDTFVDFSDSATMAKYVAAGPKPVSLGTDGSTPTGTAVKVYTGNGPTFINGAPYHNLNNGSSGGTFTVSRTAWISPVTHPPAQTFLT